MVSLSSHELFGELTLEILDYAKGLMGRCILFGAGRGGFWGTGQFGVEAPPGAPPDFIRGVRLPPDPSSVLGEAMARRALWRGPLAEHAANRELVRALGGRPEEVITAPLMVGGRVLLVLFGDRLVDPMPSGEPDRFELLLLHTAIAMERNLLAQRVEHLEELRRQTQEDLPASGLYSPNPAERTRLGESSPDAVS